ncbi:MAG: hypothetical protein JSW60_08415 [Thermoplasmatales archaeon]|nr:MAG: hypothetical protein JSW60_08415 [Thermoplasmatales archaeon]
MKRKIGFLSISIALIIILAGLSPVAGSIDIEEIKNNENIVVEINRYYGKKTEPIRTSVSYEEAEELKEILINLNEAIENNDEEAISRYERILNEKGLFGDEYQEFFSRNTFLKNFKPDSYPRISELLHKLNGDNISNSLCYFNAIGSGVLLFPFGVMIWEAIVRIVKNASSPLAGFILLLALIPVLVMVMLVTHLVPFRILMSKGIINMQKGTISSLGLKGFKRLKVDTEPVNVNISWFSGITFNIPFTNNSFLFVSGIAVRVAESDL